MAVLQSKLNEIRYVKRQNLESEARLQGNYYREVIRQYGVDCNVYKMKSKYLDFFNNIVNDNNLILHAYGQDENPDYTTSADMITYMDVQNDILMANRYGVTNNMEVTFWFDSMDFACALAYKIGQLKEYRILNTDFEVEIPECISDYQEYEVDGETKRYYLSDEIFPYAIGFQVPENFYSEILSGKWNTIIGPYEVDREYTVPCRVVEHSDVNIRIPVDNDLYKSFSRRIGTKEFVENILFLDYKVSRIKTELGDKFILHGKLRGATLFHDIAQVGKYMDLIHPEVGDIVSIDWPTDNSRISFEIYECNDKSLADGINPLLHKYVWRCKAKRYINSGEEFPEISEDTERLNENLELLNNQEEEMAKKTSIYDKRNSDSVYGGFERHPKPSDHRQVNVVKQQRFTFVDDDEYLTLMEFADHCRLATDGYELYYVDSKQKCYKLSFVEKEHIINENLVATGIQYLKATDDALWFINFDNRAQKIAEDPNITGEEMQMCINSLIDTTLDGPDHNRDGNYFYKFRESNTVLFSLDDNLYCRFGNNHHDLVKLTPDYWPDVTQDEIKNGYDPSKHPDR